jgi:hypothetical protein
MSPFKEKLANLTLFFSVVAFSGFGVAVGSAKCGVNPLMTDPQNAALAVKDKRPDLSNIRITGYGWLDCGVFGMTGVSNNAWRTRFTATNATGKTVKGTVCSGFIWGHTIKMR